MRVNTTIINDNKTPDTALNNQHVKGFIVTILANISPIMEQCRQDNKTTTNKKKIIREAAIIIFNDKTLPMPKATHIIVRKQFQRDS